MDVKKFIRELKEITDVKVIVYEDDKKFRRSSNLYGISILKVNDTITGVRVRSCENIEKILKKIVQLNSLTSLELSRCKLKKIPQSIFELESLQELDLDDSQITHIPESIVKLKFLQKLYLGSNQIAHIPESIGQLVSLQELNLSDNQISEIPESIGQLKSLQDLDLSWNQITQIPESIGELKFLQRLSLKDNQISHIPESIGQLKFLERLYLYKNQITYIPESIVKLKSLLILDLRDNQITHISESIGQLKYLQYLRLWGNLITKLPPQLCKLELLEKLDVDDCPLVDPPIEIAKQGIDAIREYFEAKEKEKVKVYEAKLMIVGEPGAGKTTLQRKLLNPEAELPEKDETTKGIDIGTWEYSYRDNNYTVNIWDFGGQQIYRSTHQFFMSERVLYVLLADSREEKTDYNDWLHRIQLFANDSPVVIVHNEMNDRVKQIDMPSLRQTFPYINEPMRCNLAKTVGSIREDEYWSVVNEIKQKIAKLNVIGQEFPKSWLDLRSQLEIIVNQDKLDYISSDKYYELCEEYGIDQRGAKVLGNYLHAIGAILFFPEDDVLKNTVILNPEWGTDAVYKVIDDERVQSSYGRFTMCDIHRIWSANMYSNKHFELLQLMKNFRICYKSTHQRDFYILPQLLKYPPEDYSWGHKADLHFRYQYSGYYLKLIMYHFIVAVHQYIEGDCVWRNCVILGRDDASAEIKADEKKGRIHIRVSGMMCDEFLAIIRYNFEMIHSQYPKLQVESMVPCNCDVCKNSDEPNLYKNSYLRDRLKHGKKIVECSKNNYTEVDIETLVRNFPFYKINDKQKWMTREETEKLIKEKGFMKIHYGDEIHAGGDVQNAKGKNINQTMTKDSKMENAVKDLKNAIDKEELHSDIKNQIQAVITEIQDNDYDLKPKVKIRLKDTLQNILQNVANVATVAGFITQLIGLLT